MTAQAGLQMIGIGMVTPLGLTSAKTCAALRCGLAAFEETRFIAKDGSWITGAEVALDEPWRGEEKLIRMAAATLTECLEALPSSAPTPPLFLCISETSRPGRSDGLAQRLFDGLCRKTDLHFPEGSRILQAGRISGALALREAADLLNTGAGNEYAVLLGVDSLMNGPALTALDRQDRLLTEERVDGLLPGEGAGAVLLSKAHAPAADSLVVAGLGFGAEPVPVAAEGAFRADGLSAAVRHALAASGIGMSEISYRISDVAGEQYFFKEVAYALSRNLKVRVENIDLLHPADGIGDTGAASLPIMLGMALTAYRKGYAAGPNVVVHSSGDDDKRGAVVLMPAAEG